MKRWLIAIAAASPVLFLGTTPAQAGSSFWSISFSSFGSCGSAWVSRPPAYVVRPVSYVCCPSLVRGPTTYRSAACYAAPVVVRPVRIVCARPVVTTCRPRHVRVPRTVTTCAIPYAPACAYGRSGRPVRLPAYTRSCGPVVRPVPVGGTPVARFAGHF